jgi:hypothetical protein
MMVMKSPSAISKIDLSQHIGNPRLRFVAPFDVPDFDHEFVVLLRILSVSTAAAVKPGIFIETLDGLAQRRLRHTAF